MKVLSLLLRNAATGVVIGGPEGLNESPELIAQEYRVAGQSDRHELASMKVLSLLLRNPMTNVACFSPAAPQ